MASTSASVFAPPAPSINTPLPSLGDVDVSFLDPAQAAILSSLQPSQPETENQSSNSQPRSTFISTSPAALQTHLTALAESLESSIDIFADGIHKIEQYRQTAERVADRVLETTSRRLEERDRAVKAKAGADGIGVGDVLRGLAGVLREQ